MDPPRLAPPTRRLGVWTILVVIAIVGSLVYGSSLRGISEFDLLRGALWLTLGAGAGWAVFIPTLWVVSRAHWTDVFHASLVAMAVGEAVLAVGAVLNYGGATSSSPVFWNLAIVGVSNVVMATVIATLLAKVGVPPLKTVALWMLVLNGIGTFAFWFLYRVLT
jgi:hypothetical protein